jgi:hypothetical protein
MGQECSQQHGQLGASAAALPSAANATAAGAASATTSASQLSLRFISVSLQVI